MTALRFLLERPVLATLAAAAVLYGGAKPPARGRITLDPYLRDTGSILTNDVVHVAAERASPLVPMASPLYVHARPIGGTNAAYGAELLPRRLLSDLPADWELADATNHDVLVTLAWAPAGPIVTNYAFVVTGRLSPTSAVPVRAVFPSTKIDTE